MLGRGQGKSSYIQNPEQARTPRAGTTRTRSRVGTPAAAPAHRTENNTVLVLLQHRSWCGRGEQPRMQARTRGVKAGEPAGGSQHSLYLYGECETDKETCCGAAEDSSFCSARAVYAARLYKQRGRSGHVSVF